ncbi:DUF551 domain-containing protein [Kluyvera ascorbata]|uniref:DUF551 domain-containing protein n=1 Tax=Kluyvera ascorbata TaxID=51288 RepID=UPI0039F72CFB
MEWIDVNQQKPEVGQDVLAYSEGFGYEAALFQLPYIPGPPFFAASYGEVFPTHWMPLPEPPTT